MTKQSGGYAELPWSESTLREILPHRPPFLLVDKVLSFEADKSIAGIKVWGQDEALIRSHAGGFVPATLMFEALAQLGAVLILTKPEHRGKLIYFMGIDKARCRGAVGPGDTLVMYAEIQKLRSRVGQLSGYAEVDGRRIIDGQMKFSLGSRS